MESRDSHMWRESLSKQATMMDNITRLKDQMKLKQSEAAETIVHLQGKLSDHDMRIGSMQKQMDIMGFLGGNGQPLNNSDSSKQLNTGDAGGSNSGY